MSLSLILHTFLFIGYHNYLSTVYTKQKNNHCLKWYFLLGNVKLTFLTFPQGLTAGVAGSTPFLVILGQIPLILLEHYWDRGFYFMLFFKFFYKALMTERFFAFKKQLYYIKICNVLLIKTISRNTNFLFLYTITMFTTINIIYNLIIYCSWLHQLNLFDEINISKSFPYGTQPLHHYCVSGIV